jgi:hypothetical protein
LNLAYAIFDGKTDRMEYKFRTYDATTNWDLYGSWMILKDLPKFQNVSSDVDVVDSSSLSEGSPGETNKKSSERTLRSNIQNMERSIGMLNQQLKRKADLMALKTCWKSRMMKKRELKSNEISTTFLAFKLSTIIIISLIVDIVHIFRSTINISRSSRRYVPLNYDAAHCSSLHHQYAFKCELFSQPRNLGRGCDAQCQRVEGFCQGAKAGWLACRTPVRFHRISVSS